MKGACVDNLHIEGAIDLDMNDTTLADAGRYNVYVSEEAQAAPDEGESIFGAKSRRKIFIAVVATLISTPLVAAFGYIWS
jgi:hypothetical protein